MSNNKLCLAAVCVALPLLVFYFSRAAAPERIQAFVGGVPAPRARLGGAPGGSRVPVTTQRRNDTESQAAVDPLPSDTSANDSMLGSSDLLLPTQDDLQNPQHVLDALLADGSIPAEEAPRLQRLVDGLAHQMPLELLRDKERMRKMLQSFALGHDADNNEDPGNGAAATDDRFPANPYEEVLNTQAAAGEGPSEEEKQQSLDQYLAITAANNPTK